MQEVLKPSGYQKGCCANVATYEELHEAITDYVEQACKSERVLRSLRHWNCMISEERVLRFSP